MTRSSPSPSAHAIPPLPPKRRLSLTPLSPNVCANNNADETRALNSKIQSTPRATRVGTSNRPPKNPSSGQTAEVKIRAIRREEGSTPGQNSAKEPKIHYFDHEEDVLLMIPDPPTPEETNSSKAAAAKFLESRAKRRRSLPILLESDRNTSTPLKISPLNASVKQTTPLSFPNNDSCTTTMLFVDHLQSCQHTEKDFVNSISRFSSNNASHEQHNPLHFTSICFDDSVEKSVDPVIHATLSSQAKSDWEHWVLPTNSTLGDGMIKPRKMEENIIECPGLKKQKGKSSRRSILIPSDVEYDGIFGFKCVEDDCIQSSSNRMEEKASSCHGAQHDFIDQPITPTIVSQTLTCDQLGTDAEKFHVIKKAVRKMCNIPTEKRYLSAEATLIGELSGYSSLNPIEKRRRACLISKGSLLSNAAHSSSMTDNDCCLTNASLEDIEHFSRPDDHMKVQLVNKLSSSMELLEEKRRKETDALENATGYRVAKKNGRFTYSDKSGKKIGPDEYERAYFSAKKKMIQSEEVVPLEPYSLKYDENGSDGPSSFVDDDHVIASDLLIVLENLQRPTSSDPTVAAAQQRLYEALDMALLNYRKEIAIHHQKKTKK